MSVAWLIVKFVLTLSILGLMAVGSYLITAHAPSRPAGAIVLTKLESATCNRTDCSGRGECEEDVGNSSSYACLCDKYNYGPLCEEECPSRCSSVGICKMFNDTTNLTSMFLDESGNVSCSCPHNYAGTACEVQCNCSSNAVCQEDGSCQCELGFSGERCEVSCGGDCGYGWCTDAGTCLCDSEHYGAQCNETLTLCENVEEIVWDDGTGEPSAARADGGSTETGSTNATIKTDYLFGEECAVNSTITYKFDFVTSTTCVGIVRISNTMNAFLYEYGQDDESFNPPNASAGVVNFDSSAKTPHLVMKSRSGLRQGFALSVVCEKQADTSCYVPIGGNEIEQMCSTTGTKIRTTHGSASHETIITTVLYDLGVEDEPPLPPHLSFTHIDGSWTPAAPRVNVLAKEAYYRPDLLSANSNAFSLGLGWLTIVVAIVCCITFLGLCLRPPRSKELTSMNTEGRFRDVVIREMKSRHALVGLCNTSAESELNLPAKFLLLFLNTFVNLALSALWFDQNSVGQMITSTLITSVCVFTLMQLMRFSLRGAHTRNEWFVPLVSYTGPLSLAVWSAYTTGLYLLQMDETNAQFFLLRAVCSFILQHTLFFAVTTILIVWYGLPKSKATANDAGIHPLPEL